MADDPQAILKNAKISLVALKEALKTKDPWDREVEFNRKDARRHYLHLIFEFAYSPQVLAMDNHNALWMETSYACILLYRTRIATLDKAIAARTAPAHSRPSGPSPVVEHRKLVQRFRQFLAEEEKFWTSFIIRFVRAFALEEARPHLDALQVTRPANGQPTGNIHLDEDLSAGRNHTFPSDSKPLAPPPTQREKKVLTLVKAIISLGDLARYKEQYNERQGRPKAGTEDVPPRWATKGSRKPGESIPRPRNYARAHACYTQAHLLLPDNGQASHQLAILSSYQTDTFGSILHYYRSICVKHPFIRAPENLIRTLEKTYETHCAEPSGLAKDDDPPRAVVDRFKKDVVILHCLWGAEKATDAELHSHTQYTLSRFSKLLAERLLPIGLVVKVYTAALGALWTLRSARRREASKSPTSNQTSTTSSGGIARKEGIVLTHIMDLHLALLKLATAQLDPATLPTTGTAPNGTTLPNPAPAEKITAVLRRILQSLRVASGWVTVNAEYLYRSANPDKAPDGLIRIMGEFWSSYAAFATALNDAFGEESTGYSSASFSGVLLEEDVDLEGFTPLRDCLKRRPAPGTEKVGTALLNQVHPNDEYLLRIRDILEDVRVLVKSQSTPLNLQSGAYMSSTEAFTPVSEHPPQHQYSSVSPPRTLYQPNGHAERPVPIIKEVLSGKAAEIPDDDVASVSTEDPVTLAMRATLGSSDDEFEVEQEDEQILFPQGTWNGMTTHSIQPSGLHPVMPLRDPHTFHLADLARSNLSFGPQPPSQMHHQAQLPSASHDVFGPSSPLYNLPGRSAQPVGGSMHYYQDMPTPYTNSTAAAYGNGVVVLPSNSPRMNQPLYPMAQNQPLFTSPYRTPGQLPNLPAPQVPITPRQPRNDRLSLGGNTPGTAVASSAAAAISPNVTPPKTAQDLLLRVLGTTPSAPASGNTTGVIGRPRPSASPPSGMNGARSSPDGHRPAPLLFAASAGNSIWAP